MKNKMKRVRPQKKSTTLALRSGNASRPPDNSGTVQIPRPITVKQTVVRRTFKGEVNLNSLTTTGSYVGISLYSPFSFYTAFSGSGYTYTPPATLTDMYACFGLYKVKRVQLIYEPLIPSTTIPAPFTVGMVFDVNQPTNTTLPASQLIDYENSTKISPLYPTELMYIVPKISYEPPVGAQTYQILSGGWITSNAGAGPSTYGTIVSTQGSPVVAGTTYAILTYVYEIWFKNPN